MNIKRFIFSILFLTALNSNVFAATKPLKTEPPKPSGHTAAQDLNGNYLCPDKELCQWINPGAPICLKTPAGYKSSGLHAECPKVPIYPGPSVLPSGNPEKCPIGYRCIPKGSEGAAEASICINGSGNRLCPVSSLTSSSEENQKANQAAARYGSLKT